MHFDFFQCLQEDFVKYQAMIETTIDLELVHQRDYLIRPSFDEKLLSKFKYCFSCLFDIIHPVQNVYYQVVLLFAIVFLAFTPPKNFQRLLPNHNEVLCKSF